MRVACGAVLVAEGTAYFANSREPGFLVLTVAAASICVGVLLIVGLLTRFAALVAAVISVGNIFAWLPVSHAGSHEHRMTAALSAVIAIALVCLGPGIVSLDARLFGRREIIIA